jgi:hypothetical protein
MYSLNYQIGVVYQPTSRMGIPINQISLGLMSRTWSCFFPEYRMNCFLSGIQNEITTIISTSHNDSSRNNARVFPDFTSFQRDVFEFQIISSSLFIGFFHAHAFFRIQVRSRIGCLAVEGQSVPPWEILKLV